MHLHVYTYVLECVCTYVRVESGKEGGKIIWVKERGCHKIILLSLFVVWMQEIIIIITDTVVTILVATVVVLSVGVSIIQCKTNIQKNNNKKKKKIAFLFIHRYIHTHPCVHHCSRRIAHVSPYVTGQNQIEKKTRMHY
uniref:Uncharacterized protein n=1 Tax=Trypanosoma vivax (strain Y486) TaxID=1055687 RepID=G0TUR9_TRYVY|nr:hypothetical protein, unlikely [Trypanosoma vivax Y486]